MLPVYRFRDGFSTLKKNDQTIEECITLLRGNESVAVFGEGNHNDQWNLRPLQKGFARIALTAEERANFKLGVKIVPIGIQYEDHHAFRTRVLVNFGPAISVSEYVNQNKSQQENLDALIKITADALKPLILLVPAEGYTGRVAYLKNNQLFKKNLIEQLKSDQELIDQDKSDQTSAPSKKTFSYWNPIFWYFYVNHFIPGQVISWIIRSKVKDHQFVGSIKFAAGIVVVPFFYAVQTAICFAATGSVSISLLYLASLPLSVVLGR